MSLAQIISEMTNLNSTQTQMDSLLTQQYERAGALIDQADGILIAAGAGMGVDSGLPDFRGTDGFWKSYPALAKASIRFDEIASPLTFVDNPRLAWGFYGHRLNLYRHTSPHDGYRLLQEIAASMPRGAFVFTSNVDGHFAKAGFASDKVCETHGSIHRLQCLDGCVDDIWPADDFVPRVNEDECILTGDLPRCPHCQGLARPNVLMFGDGGWLDSRERIQHRAMEHWLRLVDHPVVIELGAGTAIPSVRMTGQSIGCPVIRINPREFQVPRATDISLPVGALEGLQGIADALHLVDETQRRD